MGWTGIFNAIRKANGTINRKATLEREFSGWTSGDKITRMIKSGMSGSTFYAAMETSSEAGREVWALVVLTSTNGGEFRYKEMDETEGPFYYECPKGILDALTPTTSATANEWRQKCREAREKKKAAAGRIPRNAARLYITFLVDTSASKAGDSVTVERVRDQWIYVDKTGNRWRLCTAHLRNEDFIRIDKAETAEEAARNDAEEAARKAQEAPEPIKADETTTAPAERQEEPQNGPTSPATVSDKETGKDDAGTTKGAYIVQCKRHRGSWTDYSSPATLEECESIKERAEARRTCDVNGNLLQYRITHAEAPQTVTTDADGETPTAAHTEPPRATETATEVEETTSTPEGAAQTEIRTTEGSTEGQTQITTPGEAADDQSTPGQTTITAPATISDRPTDQQTTTGRRETTERQTTITPDGIQTTITTQGTTTSRTTARGSPTSAQTAPQRAATGRDARTTTHRAKAPPRAKYKDLQAIAHKPLTHIPGIATF